MDFLWRLMVLFGSLAFTGLTGSITLLYLFEKTGKLSAGQIIILSILTIFQCVSLSNAMFFAQQESVRKDNLRKEIQLYKKNIGFQVIRKDGKLFSSGQSLKVVRYVDNNPFYPYTAMYYFDDNTYIPCSDCYVFKS